ncbi:MAG: hypothetical protein KC561_01140, partial [Myxococcales bacterium]|nr:hypothetical protein [Myxococcales bacterium]
NSALTEKFRRWKVTASFLGAALEGEVCWQQTLAELNNESANPNALRRAELTLLLVQQHPEVTDEELAKALFAKLIPPLRELRDDLVDLGETLNHHWEEWVEREDAAGTGYLISAMARMVATREAFVRAQAATQTITNTGSSVERKLAQCETDRRQVRLFATVLKSGGRPRGEFRRALIRRAEPLAGGFLAQAHDLTLLLCHGHELSYQDVGIMTLEAKRWLEQGLEPRVAGYWRAYDIAPEEVMVWVKAGVNQPAAAGAWRQRGFTAIQATPWLLKNVAAEEASEWLRAGVTTVEEAMDWRRAGFRSPEEAEEWLDSGLSAEKAGLWRRDFSPKEAIHWIQAGVTSPLQARSKSNVMAILARTTQQSGTGSFASVADGKVVPTTRVGGPRTQPPPTGQGFPVPRAASMSPPGVKPPQRAAVLSRDDEKD